MRRKSIFFFLATLALFALVGAGCANNTGTQNNANNAAGGNGLRGGGNFSSSTDRWSGLEKGKVEDLAIGKKVMVFGKTNSDNTITASRVMIGEMPPFGGHFASGTPDHAPSGTPPAGGWNGQEPPTGSLGGQPADHQGPSNFNGGTRGSWQGGSRSGRSSGMSNVSGEIIKLDESSFVLKTQAGGSNIILYSSSTEFYLPPSASSTGNQPLPPASSTKN